MRKIISKDEESKIRKRNQLIVGGILIVVMLFSIIGYSSQGFQGKVVDSENEGKVNYNGLEFVEQNGFWRLNLGKFNFIFKHNPKQLEEIDNNISLSNLNGLNNLTSYLGKPLYLYSENIEAESEIRKNMDNLVGANLVERIQPACLEAKDCEGKNWPIKTCEDNFIIIKEGNKEEIKQEDNCVFISGGKDDLTKLTDKFLFRIFGIES